ncbi:MAG: hypothetical protein KFB93_02880 [Simkaniaceae bacterium]|nr:MAG: hypothetical protein KFB93_02880 [Simkaniaceae bacterium]
MEIKKTPHINTQNAERKKQEKTPPKRSFHEVMVSRDLPRQVQRRQSVFDMASKKEKQGRPSQRKKEVDHAPQHGIAQGLLTSSVSGETLSVGSASELSAEMSLLVEKMANFIQVESQNGITTTTVMVEMEGSILDGSQIVINHYDTAPHSFNLQLSGSPEGIDLFAANLASLQTSLQTHQALQGLQVHILPPTLSEKSDLYLRGKERKGRANGMEKGARVAPKKKISF